MLPINSGIYNAVGNDATCRTQGVLVQLGLTSMFYNMCLSTYFFLVISFNWKEHQFRKLQVWIHVVMVGSGMAFAFGSIPWVGPYARLTGICAVQKPPSIDSHLPLTLLLTAPMSIALTVMTMTTVAMCMKVYRGEMKANKWRADKRLMMTKTVFWRSFWYVAAFILTQPMLLIQNYRSFESRMDAETVVMLSAILAPGQGVLNSIIYFQRTRKGNTKKGAKGSRWYQRWTWNPRGSSSTYKSEETRPFGESDVVEPPEQEMALEDKEGLSGDDGSGVGDTSEARHDGVRDDDAPASAEAVEDNDEGDSSDVALAFEAVAEYWRLNELEDDSFAGREVGEDDAVALNQQSNRGFDRQFRSFIFPRWPRQLASQATSLPNVRTG